MLVFKGLCYANGRIQMWNVNGKMLVDEECLMTMWVRDSDDNSDEDNDGLR